MNKTVVLKSIFVAVPWNYLYTSGFLIIMNAFKPNNDILTSFISFPKSLYLEIFSEAMRIMNFLDSISQYVVCDGMYCHSCQCRVFYECIWNFTSSSKKGDKLYTLFVVGQIIPFHAVMIAISMLSTKLGLTNTHLGLIIFYSGFIHHLVL